MPSLTQSETVDFKTLEVGGDLIETTKVTMLAGAVYPKGAVLGRVTASNKYRTSASASSDGSQVIQPVVLKYEVDATDGDVDADVYIAGKFDPSQLVIGAGHDLAAVRRAFIGTPMFVPDVRQV